MRSFPRFLHIPPSHPVRLGLANAADYVRRHRTAVLAVVAVVGLTGAHLLVRSFSVSCGSADAACLTIDELTQARALPEALRIFAGDGTLLAETGGPLRRALPPDRMPELLTTAFVTVEDRRFYSHDGIDSRGVLRAAITNLREGELHEGASTIPMQLVRTLWADRLRGVGPWRRKVIEARTAPRLIDELGHDAVLNLYLNAIYLGNGIYGVERAARYYFGLGADQLSIGQVATLAGMTRSPEYYEPRRHPERARTVRDVALRLLTEEGVITEDEAAAAMAEPVETVAIESLERPTHQRSHLTAAVLRELERLLPALESTAGLVIHTTIDHEVQTRGEVALAAQLAAIEEGRFGAFEGPVPTTEAADADSMPSGLLQGSAVALDPTTSAVRAWVGGRDFDYSQFDRVDQSARQVGSLAKPFLVALAVEQGYGIIDMVSSDTVPIITDGEPWLPADHVQQTSLPMREALVVSSNRAAAHLGIHLGLEHLSEVGRRVGLGGAHPRPALERYRGVRGFAAGHDARLQRVRQRRTAG